MGYQTFSESETGSSSSPEKLKHLRLPKDLRGMSVLDIGCNEGFFCFEAERRGARRVLGIDQSSDAILSASSRCKSGVIEFLHQSWDTLPEEKFDLILLMSALHYAESPKRLLQSIHSRLTDDGKLVLECGFIDSEFSELHRVHRAKSVRLFPTKGLLFDSWLSDYAPKLAGRSVQQSGDPVTRYVVHCSKRRPIVWLIRGSGSTGKSTLARELRHLPGQFIKLDSLFHEIRRSKNVKSELDLFLKDRLEEGNGSVRIAVDTLMKEGEHLMGSFIDVVGNLISLDERNIIIEGYALTNEVIAALKERLKGKAVIWELKRKL